MLDQDHSPYEGEDRQVDARTLARLLKSDTLFNYYVLSEKQWSRCRFGRRYLDVEGSKVKILKNLNIEGSCLIAVSDSSQNVYKSVRNIPCVHVIRVQDLNALDVLKYKKLLLTKEAAEYINSRFGGTGEEKSR